MILNISPQTESIISHIARLQGISIEQFFINSAYEKALQLAYMPDTETLPNTGKSDISIVDYMAKFPPLDMLKDIDPVAYQREIRNEWE